MRLFALMLCGFVCLGVMTGCWNRKELNDLSIVVGFGIDKAKNQYKVSAQVVNPGAYDMKTGSANLAPVTLYSSYGPTVSEAIRRMTTMTPRFNYFAHLRILIFSEELSREGIGKTLDYMSRNREFRNDFNIIVARGVKAEQLLNFMTPLERNPSNSMFKMLEVSTKVWSPSVSTKLDQLVTSLSVEGSSAVLTGIRLKGDIEEGAKSSNVSAIKPSAHYEYGGLAIFRRDKLIGWMNEKESRGYSTITDQVDESIVTIDCPSGGKLSVSGIRVQSEIKASLAQRKPEFDITIKGEGDIEDMECKLGLQKESQLKELQTRLEDEIAGFCQAALSKARRVKSDIFGFGNALHRSNPRYWNKVKKDWQNDWTESQVHIHVHYVIRRLGTISSGVMDEMKE
ncbi:Ger(x)C family spore germination protein [Paenibacillus solisilvae]|uniref:Ger(X)C family spore germination protein n=1 Tax=Paenibacillus solisilvae TaxID=2486751 RepID=A0ABW0VVZ2_9BACL